MGFRADEVRCHLSGDGNDRRMVQARVVEAVEQVDGSRPRGSHAGCQASRQLCLNRGGECAGLFVPDADEPDRVLLANGFGHIVDGIAGNAEQVFNAVSGEHFEQNVRNGHG
ncbi:MAG: hypothetical protein U5K56_02910 [Halioglobus sp.]|nr:hypothetical protein [Halioglobus sp.]